jgi:hypothetical protein
MDDKGLQQLLLAVLSGDSDRPLRTANAESADCPPLPRFRTALLREDWSEAEDRHRLGCSHCKQVETQARSHLWHPSLPSLFWHARGLSHDYETDVAHHLQADSCLRCTRLVGLFQIDRVPADWSPGSARVSRVSPLASRVPWLQAQSPRWPWRRPAATPQRLLKMAAGPVTRRGMTR